MVSSTALFVPSLLFKRKCLFIRCELFEYSNKKSHKDEVHQENSEIIFETLVSSYKNKSSHWPHTVFNEQVLLLIVKGK